MEYTYDSLYRLTSEAITEGEITYEYDLNGNTVRMISAEKTALYVYNADNRLIRSTVQSGNNVSVEEYRYDYAGNRTSKTTNTNGSVEFVKYLNDNSNLTNVLAEIDENGAEKCVYTVGADLISQEWDGKVSVYLYDGHGSVVGLATMSGRVTDTYKYDAFGNLIKSTGKTSNNYRYCGEQFDSTTELYYLRARYMDTSTGRFISQDSYAGSISDPVSLHKYLYANSNPVMYTDPSGYCGILLSCVSATTIQMKSETDHSKTLLNIYNAILPLIKTVEPVITAIGSFAYNYILPIVAMTAVGTVVSITFSYAIKDTIKEKVSSIARAGGLQATYDNTVYILTEEDDPDDVQYVGRTNDIVKRRNAHSNNPLKQTNGKKWVFYSIFTGLNIEGARIYEQSLISTYVADELKTNHADKLGGNRINSINPEKFLDKDFLKDYGSAMKKFAELEFSFGESELLSLILDGGNV